MANKNITQLTQQTTLDPTSLLYAVTGGTTDTGLPVSVILKNTTLTGTPTIPFTQAGTGAVTRTVTSKLRDVISIKDFGAIGDGVANDDTAMAAWLASAVPGQHLYAPAGTYNFTSAKLLPLIDNVSISGDGARQTIFQYTGVSTSIDLWTIGDGVTARTGWSLSGFRFDSTTTMTSGAALHLKRMQNGNELFDLDAGVFTQATRHLWNGIWLDNVNILKYTNFNIQVQNEGLQINGSATSDEGSDVFLDNGVITFSSIGYHIGGGQGGVYFSKVLAFDNNVNYRIDNGLVARKNREIFFSDQAVSDGNTNYGIHINDTLTSNSPIVINAHVGSAGLFGSGGAGYNIYVQSWPNGRITVGPGQLYNATSDGLRVSDASTIISIDPARHIFNNGGYGINATVADNNIYNYAQYMASNTSGNLSTNVSSQSFSGSFGYIMNYIPGNQRAIQWAANGVPRWQWFTDGSTESGSNAGSNMGLGAYGDGGAFLNTWITITRATGKVTFSGSIQPSTTAGIVGTTLADSANAGSVGEFISSSIPVGSAVSLTSNTATNITSISLTAGDWDVWGTVTTNPAGTTTTSSFTGAISTISGVFPVAPNGGGTISLPISATGGVVLEAPVGTTRINISTTTTVYLVLSVTFAVSTCGGYGFIGARRRR